MDYTDFFTSRAFAVVDHQIAHVYVNDRTRIEVVKRLLEAVDGVERVLDEAGKKEMHLDHARSGELVVIAKPQAWFTYYYWLDESRAPDFARTVDIHRKPGYDPAELFLDPNLTAPKLKIARTLLQKKLGFRYLMDVIPLDASLVKGSHGRAVSQLAEGPMLMTRQAGLIDGNHLEAIDVCGVILKHLDFKIS